MNIFTIFHNLSKTTEETPHIEGDSNAVSQNNVITENKTYPRFKSRALPDPEKNSITLEEVIKKRISGRVFNKNLSLENLSSILSSIQSKNQSSSPNDKDERMYPSAGGTFPIESYVLLFQPLKEYESGVYHYDPHSHSLTLIKKIIFNEKLMSSLVMYEYATSAKLAIIFTATFDRITKKYGERGYRFALIEAGCMAQNITLNATAVGVDSVHMGGIIDTQIEALLSIDGTHESVVHGVFLG